MNSFARTLTIGSAVGAGLSAGVFLAFSTFVMTSVRRLPATQGMAAMQAINKAAPQSPVFMIVLFGTGVGCVVVAVDALRALDEPGAWLRLAGAATYLVVIVITAAYHVPHNDTLAALDPHSEKGLRYWADYAPSWTRWNHARTLAGAAAAGLLTAACR